MTTVQLVPVGIELFGAERYITVTNVDNACTNTSSTTYATIQNTRGSTASMSGLLYFDFSSIPSNATVTSYNVKIKAYGQNVAQSGSAIKNKLCMGQRALGISGTESGYLPSALRVAVVTITTSSLPWSEIAGYVALGYKVGINVPCTRSTTGSATYAYVYGAEINVTYTEPVVAPVITVGTPSRNRISAKSGYDQATCTFQSDLALQAWEARATKSGTTPARGVGLLVESGNALAANTNATIYVENEELTDGDGRYTISVYGQSTGGVWSG